jgi:hypothetical protein
MMTMMTTSGTVTVIPDAAGANPFGKSSLTKSFSPAREALVSSKQGAQLVAPQPPISNCSLVIFLAILAT